MYCAKCGAENPENMNFCVQCGASLSEQSTKNITDNSDCEMIYEPYDESAAPAKSLQDVIKTVACSPVFLVAVIAYTIKTAVSFVAALLGQGGVFALINTAMDIVGGELSYEMNEIVDMIGTLGQGVIVSVSLIGILPSVLICIGLWLTYSSAVSKKTISIKTGGLTTIKVIYILEVIKTCLIFLGVVLAATGVMMALGSEPSSEEYMSIIVTIIAGSVMALAFIAAIFVFVIVYISKILSSINGVKKAVTTGVAKRKASAFVAVCGFIGALFGISAIFVNAISGVAEIVSLICFGITIFKYNSSIKAFITEE